MLIYKLALIASIIISGTLSTYLFELLQRTNFLITSTSIGLDVIYGFHILAAISIAIVIFGLYESNMPRPILVPMLMLALIVEVAFLGLNISETVWCFAT